MQTVNGNIKQWFRGENAIEKMLGFHRARGAHCLTIKDI